MNNRQRPRRGKPIGDYKNISKAAFQAAAPRPEPDDGKDERHRYGGASAGMLSAVSGRLGLIERQMQMVREQLDRIEKRQAAIEILPAGLDATATVKHLEAIRVAIRDMTEAVGALGTKESW